MKKDLLVFEIPIAFLTANEKGIGRKIFKREREISRSHKLSRDLVAMGGGLQGETLFLKVKTLFFDATEQKGHQVRVRDEDSRKMMGISVVGEPIQPVDLFLGD